MLFAGGNIYLFTKIPRREKKDKGDDKLLNLLLQIGHREKLIRETM